MKPLTLYAHAVRRLLSHGSVLVVRPVKPQPPQEYRLWGPVFDGYAAWTTHPTQGEKGEIVEMHCPLGVPGTEHWARETWRRTTPDLPNGLEYRADGLLRWFDGSDEQAALASVTYPRDGRWRSPVIMPAWASRFSHLTVGEVRCVRLSELSADDARSTNPPDVVAHQLWPTIADWHPLDAMQLNWTERYGELYPWPGAWAWAVVLTVQPDSPAKEESQL